MDRSDFHELAEPELTEVAQYYDLEEPGLGVPSLMKSNAYKIKPSGIRVLAVMI
jgi:hypothetical protein